MQVTVDMPAWLAALVFLTVVYFVHCMTVTVEIEDTREGDD